MTFPRGTYYRTRVYSSGKKMRLAISPEGRILESTPVASRAKKSRTGKRLAAMRRRLHR